MATKLDAIPIPRGYRMRANESSVKVGIPLANHNRRIQTTKRASQNAGHFDTRDKVGQHLVLQLDHTFAEARFSASSRLLVAGKNTTLSMVWISSSWTTQRINNEVNSSSGVSSETRDYNVIRNWLSYNSFKVAAAAESNHTQWVASKSAPPFQPMSSKTETERVFFFFFLFFPALQLKHVTCNF